MDRRQCSCWNVCLHARLLRRDRYVCFDFFQKHLLQYRLTILTLLLGLFIVCTVLFVPGSILTLGAGFVFANAFGLGVGLLIGTLSVFFGASAGAIIAFLLGRYLLRDWVQGLASKYAIFEALDVGTCTIAVHVIMIPQ